MEHQRRLHQAAHARTPASASTDPALDPLQIAFGRAFFAGLALLPLLRRGDVSFRPAMLVTAVCFAAMNALYVTAMAIGSAANAVFLQYTAPMWLALVGVFWLKEPADRRTLMALAVSMVGVAVIVVGGWGDGGQLIAAGHRRRQRRRPTPPFWSACAVLRGAPRAG